MDQRGSSNAAFSSSRQRAFTDVFTRLDDRAALDAWWYLGTPVSVMQRRFDNALENTDAKENLSVPRAVNLIVSYFSAQAHQNIAPALGELIGADDRRRYVIDTDVLIKTKEGATLSAIVVRRVAGAKRRPTSLFFNIYTNLDMGLYEAKMAALHDYVGVVADSRGKRLSPDRIEPWEHEVRDTYAVIDWVSRQSWSDGQIGMYGSSYAGFAQWAAAKSGHPALKTIVPSAASQPGFGVPMQNNVFQYAQYAWPFYVMNSKYLDEATYFDANRWNALNKKWYASGRPFREIDALDGTPNVLLQRQLQHPSFDAYWQAMQPYKEDYARIDIPVLSITGYYDDANASAVNYLREHYEYNPRAQHYLAIGPYDHGSTSRASKPAVVKGYSIDPAAQLDSVGLTYQWFDHVMRHGPRPPLLKDRINYQLMGADTWRHAPSLDRMGNDKLRLYLSNEEVDTRYRLTTTKPTEAGFLVQTVDFSDRTTTHNLYPTMAIARELSTGNALAFLSEPFEAPLAVSGQISGELVATIDKRDMDFAVALYEMMPHGQFFHLSYYLGRASHAEDMSVRKLLTPDRPAAIPFERTPLIARQMSKNSRLLLLLTVNKNEWAQVNYGTGKDVSDESIADAKEPLQVKWHNASYVDIPISR